MKFSIKDFFSKCDQTRSFLRIWSHLLKKSLTKLHFFVKCYLFRCLIVLRSFSNQFCDYKLEARKSSLIFQAWNLSGFSTISFKGNQSMTFSDSFWASGIKLSTLFDKVAIASSSAKLRSCASFMKSNRSFIKTLKSRGPRMDTGK